MRQVWQAFNGECFNDQDECIRYEARLAAESAINRILLRFKDTLSLAQEDNLNSIISELIVFLVEENVTVN